MLKIVILNYATGTVSIHNMRNGENVKDILQSYGHRIEDCHYMITENLSIDIGI